MRKMTAVVDVPSLMVDWIWSTPVTLATASSISLVTWVSSSAGDAPLCATLIDTIGTSMLGKRVIGRRTND